MTAINHAVMEWGVTAFACCPGANEGGSHPHFIWKKSEPLLCPYHGISHDSPRDFKSPFCVCHHPLLPDLVLLTYFYQLSPPTCSPLSHKFVDGVIHSKSQSPTEVTNCWPRIFLLGHVHTVTNGSGSVWKFWEISMDSSRYAPFDLCPHSFLLLETQMWVMGLPAVGWESPESHLVGINDSTVLDLDHTLWCTVSSASVSVALTHQGTQCQITTLCFS